MNRLALVFSAVCYVLALLIGGCGAVTTAADTDSGVTDATKESSPEAPTEVIAPSVDASGGDAAPACSWSCYAFCSCGALPCCRAAGAADCCTP